MTERNDGGPAFPVDDLIQRDSKGALTGAPVSSSGMTLRDYFAAQAMQGLWGAFNRDWHNPNDYQIKVVARNAYVVADAMLEARK